MPHPKGNMKMSGDVHLPEDEDELQVETITSGVNGAADGEGALRSAARVRQADVVTAGDEDQGRLSLMPGQAEKAPSNPPRMVQAQPKAKPAPKRSAPKHLAPERVKAAAARAGNSPYAFWAVSLLAVLAAVRMVR